MTSNSRMLALALSSLLGMSGGLPAVGGMEKAPIPSRAPAMRPSRKAILSGSHYTGIIRFGYMKSPPGTVAQSKRAAIKIKNRAKHRRACRVSA